MMLVLDAARTREHLPFGALIATLRERFAGACEVPTRHAHTIGTPHGDGTLLLMPAWRPGARLGIKAVTIFPGNRDIGLPSLHGTYLLLDATTGQPLAQLDGTEITSRRTAAASALAASFLARADAQRLLVVGAGRVAALIPEALRQVRPIARVEVWNRTAGRADALVRAWREAGWDAHRCPELERGTRDADIVCCATLSTEPLIAGHWLAPGTHLDLIGSFTPAMREADAACFAHSRVYVDTREALVKSGDMIQAREEGAFAEDDLQGTLSALCRGQRTGRQSATERTLFKSVGTALEDLAAAELVFDAAEARRAWPGDPLSPTTLPP